MKSRPPADNVPRDSSGPDDRSLPETDAVSPGGESEISGGILHHVRRGLRRARVPELAGHAARIGSHGWRRVSTAAAAVDSGGRISRPVGALWGKVARRIPARGGLTGDNPEGHRNRRLAFDFAVVAAACALLLMLHHQFRHPHHPRVAEAFAATVPVAEPEHSDPAAPRHRRRAHKPAPPVGAPDAHVIDGHPGDPIAMTDPHHDAGLHHEPDAHSHLDGGGDFGNHPDAGHRVDHPVLPPPEVEVKATRPALPPNDSKPTADAALDTLLSAPVPSGLPHGNAAAPVGQSEPLPPRDFEKPAHPHAAEPLLVDNREPGDSGPPPKHEHIKKSADLSAPLPDDFAAPLPATPHDDHHHEPKDHGPKDIGLKEVAKDDFALPAPGPAVPPPGDVPPLHDDAKHHPHHHDDHGPADHPPADDPLLDVGPNVDTPHPGAPAGPPPKSPPDNIEVSKHDHPDEGLPVLSVPSPHKHDAHLPEHDAKLAGDGPKSDGPKIDDLGPPPRTASASDVSLGGSPDAAPSKALPPKPPETKPPANDASLDDLLNSKVPSGPSAPAAKPSSGAVSAGPAAPPSAPVAGPKDDPFHTDAPAQVDAPLHTDAPPHAGPPPKQAEPAVEIVAPLPKPHPEPPHVVEEDSQPSVAVAHHPLEKDESGGLLRYKIVVRNKGKKAVKTFEVDEAVPAEHTVRVTDPPAEIQAQELHWTLHDVAPGEERTILVTLTPPPAPPAAPHVAIAEPPAAAPTTIVTEPIPAAASHDAKIESPQLTLELITPVEVHAGETCRIGFRATNLGSKATDLKLNLDLPEQLRYARGQQLQYKIGALGDHESREDYLTATASGTGQVELRAELLQSGHSIATAKGSCRVAPVGAPRGGIQQTGAWSSGAAARTANGSDCLCWP